MNGSYATLEYNNNDETQQSTACVTTAELSLHIQAPSRKEAVV